MSRRTQEGSILLLLILVLVILIGGLIIFFPKNFGSNTPSPLPTSAISQDPQEQLLQSTGSAREPEEKIYLSQNIHFSIKVPNAFQISEKFTRVTITKPSNPGSIVLDKTSTNFENINTYIQDLSTKNNFDLVEKEETVINNLPTIKGFINERKSYFIYSTENTVIQLFTDSKDLYADLDQIAQSFRYTP